jgi:glycosyltransferase involved in cell wall biosynthesis
MTFSSTPRVLLSAYQCGPGMGSVSQIGWEWYSRLARRLPTTLVTHVRNRETLQRAGAPLPHSDVVFIDTEWFAGPLYRLASRLFPRSEHAVFLVSSLDYFVYDWQAVRQLQPGRHNGARWDVVHAVTPVSTVAPTRLHRLGRPVILGPLNSGLGTPPAFRDIMREESSWLYPIRSLGRLLDVLFGSTRRAAVILTATRATRESIPRRYQHLCTAMLENGVDLTRFAATPWPPGPAPDAPLRILFVGRLIPLKGIPMLFEAVAQVRLEFPVTLTIVGDGPMRENWQAQARTRGLDHSVSFLGACSLDEVARQMQAAHVFCLPSVRESGGAVLLEAMASARPVVAISFGGPAEVVDDAVGRGIPPDGPEAVTAALAETFRDIVRHPDSWWQRGEEGRRRAEARYDWDAKITEAIGLYRQVMGHEHDHVRGPAGSILMNNRGDDCHRDRGGHLNRQRSLQR